MRERSTSDSGRRRRWTESGAVAEPAQPTEPRRTPAAAGRNGSRIRSQAAGMGSQAHSAPLSLLSPAAAAAAVQLLLFPAASGEKGEKKRGEREEDPHARENRG